MAGRTNKAVLSYLAVLSLLAFRVDVSHNCIVICKASQSLCSHFRLPSVKMARFAASSRCRLFTRVDICWRRDYLLKRHLETPVVSKTHLHTNSFQPPTKSARCQPFQAWVSADLAVFALLHQHNRRHPSPRPQSGCHTGHAMRTMINPWLCKPQLRIPSDVSLSA